MSDDVRDPDRAGGGDADDFVSWFDDRFGRPDAESVAATSEANVVDTVAPALGNAIASATNADDEMVEAVPVDVSTAPKAMAIVEEDAVAEPVKTSGKTHLVKKGDTITKIAKQYKVTQDELMQANSITDPTKLKAGANLIIP